MGWMQGPELLLGQIKERAMIIDKAMQREEQRREMKSTATVPYGNVPCISRKSRVEAARATWGPFLVGLSRLLSSQTEGPRARANTVDARNGTSGNDMETSERNMTPRIELKQTWRHRDQHV